MTKRTSKITSTSQETNTATVAKVTTKITARQQARIRLVRKMDRILRNHSIGTNPLHHHPMFDGSYHYSDMATNFGLTRAQVATIDKLAHKTKTKKQFIIKVCKFLRIAPTAIDARWTI